MHSPTLEATCQVQIVSSSLTARMRVNTWIRTCNVVASQECHWEKRSTKCLPLAFYRLRLWHSCWSASRAQWCLALMIGPQGVKSAQGQLQPTPVPAEQVCTSLLSPDRLKRFFIYCLRDGEYMTTEIPKTLSIYPQYELSFHCIFHHLFHLSFH